MNSWFHDLFGVEKPIVAMVHLPGLPGRPRHDRTVSMQQVAEAVVADVQALQGAGVDGLLFCNEADLPYQLHVGAEAAAAMASIIGQVRREVQRPFGVNLVWDPVRVAGGGTGHRRVLRARGVHRRVRERPRADATGLRLDRRLP